jgi:hypothetical protein
METTKPKTANEPQRTVPVGPLRLDLGCGPNKAPGFVGVDVRSFPGVDVVLDLRGKWPWQDGTVDELYCSHFVEHLDGDERIHFVNEAYRIMKVGAKATIITPHWGSTRAYGDLTHKWPPVSEFWYLYLRKEWRDSQAPHNDQYRCDFDTDLRYTLSPVHEHLDQEGKMFALKHYRDAADDLIAVMVKRG